MKQKALSLIVFLALVACSAQPAADVSVPTSAPASTAAPLAPSPTSILASSVTPAPAGTVRPLPPPGPTPTPAAPPVEFVIPTPVPYGAAALSRLRAFPRPARDNGWGIHWTPSPFGQTTATVDFLVREVKTLGMTWVKFMHGDDAKLDQEYLVRALAANGIMPVMRVYKPFNDPYEHLRALVRAAKPLGVHYYELHNEPNVNGPAGGWRPGEPINVARLLDLWIPAAEAIIQEGAFPGLPSLAPGGDYDDIQFLHAFLDGIRARGRADLLQRAWLPLHNYFLNHPPDYPDDEVSLKAPPLSELEITLRRLQPDQVAAINRARALVRQSQPGGRKPTPANVYADSNGFRKFEAYQHIFFERFGYVIPIISTEGGAIAASSHDPRYAPVIDDDVRLQTLAAYRYMIERAPAYYFAFTPWVLANIAGGHGDFKFEQAAWYRLDGTTLPVVDAIKKSPLIGQTRRNTP